MANFFSVHPNEKKLLAIIDNMHDFLKGTRVPENLRGVIKDDITRFAYPFLNGIGNIVLNNTNNIMDYIKQLTNRKVSAISTIEDETVSYYEQKYKAELRTNKRKKYTYDDLYNEINTIFNNNVDEFLTSISDIDIVELEFDNGASFATFPIDKKKKIGEFITKFYFPQSDDQNNEINFTFDGGSGIFNKFLETFEQCKNLIIPQNISDSACTTIGHFNKSPTRIIYKFPISTSTPDGARYNCSSNVLTDGIFDIYFTDNQFGAGKKNTAFDFNIEKISPNSIVSLKYDENTNQGPGVTYLAKCMYHNGGIGTFPSPATSSIMKINDIYTRFGSDSNKDEYKKLLLDMKRDGDWGPPDACNKLIESGMQKIVLGSGDRLCNLKTRFEQLNCVYINDDELILYRFQRDQHMLLNVISSHINTIEDAIDSLNELPILNHDFSVLETLSKCGITKNFRFKSDTIGVSSYIGNFILETICSYISQLKKLYADYNAITIVDITEQEERNSIGKLISHFVFMKNALKYIVPYVKDLDSNISATPTPIEFENDGNNYNITIDNDNVIINKINSDNSSEEDSKLTDLINERDTKIATDASISKISKILNIRYNENGTIKPWGELVTDGNFFAKTIDSKHHYPNSYDYDSLEKIDKGIKTIFSYKTARGDGDVRPSRTAKTVNYADNPIMINFFQASLKIQGILFPSTDPVAAEIQRNNSNNLIFNMLKQFSIFYPNTQPRPLDLSIYATEIGYYNDMYMSRCKYWIERSEIQQPQLTRGGSIDNYKIQSGGDLTKDQIEFLNMSIREINWYIINSMPLYELDIIDHNPKLNPGYINEILCTADIMLEEFIIFYLDGDESFLYNSLDSIYELEFIITIIMNEFPNSLGYLIGQETPLLKQQFSVPILTTIVENILKQDNSRLLGKLLRVAEKAPMYREYNKKPVFFTLLNNYLLRNNIETTEVEGKLYTYTDEDLYFSFVERIMNNDLYSPLENTIRDNDEEDKYISVAFLDNFINFFNQESNDPDEYEEGIPVGVDDNDNSSVVSESTLLEQSQGDDLDDTDNERDPDDIRINNNNTIVFPYPKQGTTFGDYVPKPYNNDNLSLKSPLDSQMRYNGDEDQSNSPRSNLSPRSDILSSIRKLFRSPNKGINLPYEKKKRVVEAIQKQNAAKAKQVYKKRNIPTLIGWGGTRKNKRKQPKKYKSYNRKIKTKTNRKSNRKSKKHTKSKTKRKPNKTQRKHR